MTSTGETRRPSRRRRAPPVHALAALLAPLAAAAPAPPPSPNPLVAPARTVSDYLEAIAAAAPPRPRGTRAPPSSTGDEPRWARARELLAPRSAPALADGPGAGMPIAPWAELGREGAFLGYELTGVRRTAGGRAVVTARERSLASPDAPVLTTACAYLVVPEGGRWLIASRRCGADFSEADVRARDAGARDPPAPAAEPLPPDVESLPDDPE